MTEKILKEILVTGNSAISIANKAIIAHKLTMIEKNISVMLKKQDQLVTREIKAAFDAINDLLISNSEETIKQRLIFAENNLLKNTRLNTELTTEEKSNKYWISLSNIGLSFVCGLRNDIVIGVRHILKSFEANPQIAREIFPEFYNIVFKRKILYQESKWEKWRIKWKEKAMDRFLDKAGKVSVVIGVGALSILLRKAAPAAKTIDFMQRQNQLTENDIRNLELKKLGKEKRHDIFCSNIATSLLKEFSNLNSDLFNKLSI